MVPHQTDSTTPSRKDVAAEPDWRWRCRFAQSLISHRRTADGLAADVTQLVAAVLASELDAS